VTSIAGTHAVTACARPVARNADDGPIADARLVDLFVSGNDAAFATLIDRHKDRLYRFVRFVLVTPHADAEDLTQEIFIEAYRALPSFERRSSFRTWLYAIARNVTRHHRRRPVWDGPAADDDEALIGVPDGRPDPLAALEHKRVQRAVRAAINTLSPHHRAAIFMREIDGLSYHEIAEALHVPVGTVRSRLHNARALLVHRLCDTHQEC
jgi:RNA polymerase sigma-70 factor (ECF subfamily)